jgi:hypothetical protein
MIKEWLQAAPQNRSVTVMRFMEEEWEAAMAALRDLHVTANRLCGEAAQDKAKADYEIIYENSIARAHGLRAAIDARNETKPVGQHDE